MITLTIHRTETGYRYADTEHESLWTVLEVVAADLWPAPTDTEVRWLRAVLTSPQRRVWVRGTRVEMAS